MAGTRTNYTIKEAKELLKPHGITINSRPDTGEYRVSFMNGSEATAYYATDIMDAIGTGIAMAERKKDNEARETLERIANTRTV